MKIGRPEASWNRTMMRKFDCSQNIIEEDTQDQRLMIKPCGLLDVGGRNINWNNKLP